MVGTQVADVLNWLIMNAPGIVVGVLSAIIIWLLKPLRDRFWSGITGSANWLWAAMKALPNHLRLRRFVFSGRPLWSYGKSKKIDLRGVPPVITVMNFKGGVGKTTIAANIAAALSLHGSLRVLLVDLDYQASLSDLLRESQQEDDGRNLLGEWIGSNAKQSGILEASMPARGLANVRLVSVRDGLTDVEDNLMLRWLIRETRDDVRSRIARRLASRITSCAEHFDVVIMDAPPRLSLSSINALRASKFVLVPTKLQPLSSRPIAKMVQDFGVLRERIGGDFQIMGVICNMTEGYTARGTETSSLASIETALAALPNQPPVISQYIPDRVDIGRPQGTHLAYLLPSQRGDEVRKVFDAIADEIMDLTGLERRIANAAE